PLALFIRVFFFFRLSGAPRDLHSFPTRRSSDLKSQDALGKKLRAKDSATDNVRRLLKKARTTANRKNAELKASRVREAQARAEADRKSTRLNSSHVSISYAVFCLKKKKNINTFI